MPFLPYGRGQKLSPPQAPKKLNEINIFSSFFIVFSFFFEEDFSFLEGSVCASIVGFFKIFFTSSEISSSCDCFKTFAQLWSIFFGPKTSEESRKSRFCVEKNCFFLVDFSENWGCWGEMGPYISWKWRDNRKKCRLRRKRAELKMRNCWWIFK